MRFWAMLVMCSVALLSALVAHADDGEVLSAQGRALWERHWRSYAMQCAEFEDGFLVCPLYDKRFPSGAGVTVRQAEAALQKKIRVGGGGVVVTKVQSKPVEEAEAVSLPIPKLKVGEYGYLASVKVEEVLGETSMRVEDLYLLDPERVRKDYRDDRKMVREAEEVDDADEQLEARYKHRQAVLDRHKDKRHRAVKLRLEGFDTVGLAEGDRWPGPEGEGLSVVIVKQEYYGSERRPKQRLVAVSVGHVDWGIGEEAFVRLLSEHGLDREGFVVLIQEQMAQRNPKAARGRVFQKIMTGKPKAPADTSNDEAEAGGSDAKD